MTSFQLRKKGQSVFATTIMKMCTFTEESNGDKLSFRCIFTKKANMFTDGYTILHIVVVV